MEFLKEFLKDFLEELHRGATASEIPEEASSVESLALLNAPRPGGGFGRSPLDNNSPGLWPTALQISSLQSSSPSSPAVLQFA